MAAIQGKDVWLTAFTDVIEALLSASPKITMKSDSDAIEEYSWKQMFNAHWFCFVKFVDENCRRTELWTFYQIC